MLFYEKKSEKRLQIQKKVTTFAPVKTKGHGSVAQLNRASDYGSEGYRFESCRSHEKEFISDDELFFRIYFIVFRHKLRGFHGLNMKTRIKTALIREIRAYKKNGCVL